MYARCHNAGEVSTPLRCTGETLTSLADEQRGYVEFDERRRALARLVLHIIPRMIGASQPKAALEGGQ